MEGGPCTPSRSPFMELVRRYRLLSPPRQRERRAIRKLDGNRTRGEHRDHLHRVVADIEDLMRSIARYDDRHVGTKRMHAAVDMHLAASCFADHHFLAIVAVRWRRSSRRDALLPHRERVQAVAAAGKRDVVDTGQRGVFETAM